MRPSLRRMPPAGPAQALLSAGAGETAVAGEAAHSSRAPRPRIQRRAQRVLTMARDVARSAGQSVHGNPLVRSGEDASSPGSRRLLRQPEKPRCGEATVTQPGSLKAPSVMAALPPVVRPDVDRDPCDAGITQRRKTSWTKRMVARPRRGHIAYEVSRAICIGPRVSAPRVKGRHFAQWSCRRCRRIALARGHRRMQTPAPVRTGPDDGQPISRDVVGAVPSPQRRSSVLRKLPGDQHWAHDATGCRRGHRTRPTLLPVRRLVGAVLVMRPDEHADLRDRGVSDVRSPSTMTRGGRGAPTTSGCRRADNRRRCDSRRRFRAAPMAWSARPSASVRRSYTRRTS